MLYPGHMKTAVSMPDSIFKAAEELAKRLGMSRSALFTQAVSEFIKKHKNERITAALDEIYEGESSTLDHAFQEMQSASRTDEEW